MGILEEISAERQRQVNAEGWSLDHDDGHRNCELALAAGCYALYAGLSDDLRIEFVGIAPVDWPWDANWWKPKDRRRDLVRAAALIVAEIERLDRSTSKTTGGA